MIPLFDLFLATKSWVVSNFNHQPAELDFLIDQILPSVNGVHMTLTCLGGKGREQKIPVVQTEAPWKTSIMELCFF